MKATGRRSLKNNVPSKTQSVTKSNLVDDVVEHSPISRSCGRSFQCYKRQHFRTRSHVRLLMTSSPRSSEAADVVDPPGIPAARRCGGGVGEIPAGLRQAGAGEKWRREVATRERCSFSWCASPSPFIGKELQPHQFLEW